MEFLAHGRGVGNGLAGARWLSEVGCAGKRLSEMGSSLTWAFGEHVLQGIVAVPLEVVGCGGDAVEACSEDDCEGKVAEGSVVCRAVAGALQAGVLPEGGIASAVVRVFDGPMSWVEGEETLWRCLCMGERGDPAGMFDGGVAGSGVLSLAGFDDVLEVPVEAACSEQVGSGAGVGLFAGRTHPGSAGSLSGSEGGRMRMVAGLPCTEYSANVGPVGGPTGSATDLGSAPALNSRSVPASPHGIHRDPASSGKSRTRQQIGIERAVRGRNTPQGCGDHSPSLKMYPMAQAPGLGIATLGDIRRLRLPPPSDVQSWPPRLRREHRFRGRR